MIACCLVLALALILVARHSDVWQLLLGIGLTVACLGYLSGWLWRDYTVVTKEGVSHVDLWGLRRRFLPVNDMSVSSRDRRTNFGVLKPTPELLVASNDRLVRLDSLSYSGVSLRHALRILSSQGVAIGAKVSDDFRLGQDI
jgi:hypothetical protein